MRDLYEAGEASKGELLDVRSQLESEKLKLTQARNELQLSRLNLVQLLQLKGEEARSFSVQAPPGTQPPSDSIQGDPVTIFNKALEQMPSIKAAEASIKSAEEGLTVAQGGRSPTLSFSGSIGTGFSGQRKRPVGEPEVTCARAVWRRYDRFYCG